MAKSTLIHTVATSLSWSLQHSGLPHPHFQMHLHMWCLSFPLVSPFLPVVLYFSCTFQFFLQVYVSHLITIFFSRPFNSFSVSWFSSIPPSLWLWPSRTNCVFLITSWRARAWLRSASRCRLWWTRPPADAISADRHADGMSHDAATHFFHVPAATSTFVLLNCN